MVDNLHASSFTRADQEPDVDLDTVNGQGIMACRANTTATAERHYPIQQAGTLFYGTAAYKSANQIYGSFNSNRWFVRGGGTSPTAKTAWAEIWTTGNFNPDDKFGFSADQLSDLNNAPNNAFFVGAYNATNSPVQNSWSNGFTIAYGNNTDFRKQFCYAGEKWWTRGRDGVNWGTWRQIWDSGNLNPGNYLLLSGGTMTGDIAFGSNGRSLRGSDGGNIAGVLYDTPNARYVTAIGTGSRRLILVSPASIYRGAGGVAENYMIYDSGNFNPDNYLPLSGNKMITGDFQFKDGVSVRDAAGRSVVGLLDVAGDGVCVVVGNSAKKTRIVTPNDTPVYRNDGKGAYRIYDSSNSNISTVDWAAKNITAAGTVTATKLVLGGITIDVYNGALRVNGNLVATGGVTSLATA